MEDLLINANELRLLRKFQNQLEKCYGVKICMPKFAESNSDVFFIEIRGEKPGRDCVKKFLSEKMNVSKKSDCKENPILITLSDSEEETSIKDDSVCVIDTSSTFKDTSESSESDLNEDPVCTIDGPICAHTSEMMKNGFKCKTKKRKTYFKYNQMKKVRSNIVLSPEIPELCEVTSTTDDVVRKRLDNRDESIIILNEFIPRFKPLQDFIPLSNKKRKAVAFENMRNQQNSSNSVAGMIPVVRTLRPIVIDGSNVAIEHGKTSECFSPLGIQLAIDFFLKRGHTEITCFVPRYRRTIGVKRKYPTKDPEILDELAKKNLLVFTPSRYVEGKRHLPYDDRFIVELAASNNGVIVSNDNYRDLAEVDASFKEAIHKRLLMFCFVGNKFMVPDDPWGWNGPRLVDYLSFPPDGNQ